MKWNFPSNNDGSKRGVNDSGIESFTGNPLNSLTREIIQNSSDAKSRDDEPVIVKFGMFNIEKNKVPGYVDINNAITSCYNYRKNKVGEQFFQEAKKTLEIEKIPILKISDYNTIGLKGSRTGEDGPWENLVKTEGASDKTGDSGGSFGIGKNAPFACSNLRTVFYSTMDEEQDIAFQGVSKLISFPDDRGSFTQGIGFYGNPQGNKPIHSFHDLDEIFSREEIGTDIYILGFSQPNDWEEEVIVSILENFLVAIYYEKLIVHVGTIIVNKENLELLIDKYIKNKNFEEYFSAIYFKALTSDKKKMKIINYKGYGEVEFHLLYEEGLNKKVAMVRSTGMKIFDKGQFRVPQDFTAIAFIKGLRINSILRLLENPQHDKWEKYRNIDKVNLLVNENKNKKINKNTGDNFVKGLIKELNEFIKENMEKPDSESMDIKGLGDFLPDDFEEALTPSSADELDKIPKKIDIEIKKQKHNKSIPFELGIDEGDDGNGENGGVEEEGSGGGILPKPIDPPNIPPNGGGGSDSSPKKGSNGVELKNVRIFLVDDKKGKYQVNFTPTKTVEGYLHVYIAGEQGNEKAYIKEGKRGLFALQKNAKNLNVLGPLKMTENKRETIYVTLNSSLRLALEVFVNEV